MNKILSVAFLLLFSSVVFAAHSRMEIFYSLPPQAPGTAIMFLGDSITEAQEWQEFLENSIIINRGIGGWSACNFAWSWSVDYILAKDKPKKLFIQLGINDILQGKTLLEFTEAYRRIIEVAQYVNPYIEIYIQGIFPINYTMPGRLLDFNWNPIIDQWNSTLMALAIEKGCVYVDIHNSLSNSDGQLDPNYSIDGVHLNQYGYVTWKYVLSYFGLP